MDESHIINTVETITTDGTLGYSVKCVAVGVILLFFLGMIYQFYKYVLKWCENGDKRAAIKDKMLHNEVYLDDVYTAYKAGLVHKEAKENGIDMKFNTAVSNDSPRLIKKLNGEVDENLSE